MDLLLNLGQEVLVELCVGLLLHHKVLCCSKRRGIGCLTIDLILEMDESLLVLSVIALGDPSQILILCR